MVEKLEALRKGHWTDFFSNRNPICPHCEAPYNIEENEAYELYDHSRTHRVECPSCDLVYIVTSRAEWTFSTDEQDE
jgi:hypothetical protein